MKIEKRDTEQAHLCLALPGISLSDPERFSLDLLNVILGEGMSSRLFSEIRDKLGLAYSISSYVEHFWIPVPDGLGQRRPSNLNQGSQSHSGCS